MGVTLSAEKVQEYFKFFEEFQTSGFRKGMIGMCFRDVDFEVTETVKGTVEEIWKLAISPISLPEIIFLMSSMAGLNLM